MTFEDETRLLEPSKTHEYDNTGSGHNHKDQIVTVVKICGDGDNVDCGLNVK